MASIDSTNYSKTQIDNVQPVQQTIINVLNTNTFDTITVGNGSFTSSLRVGGINVVDLSSSQVLTNKDLTSGTNSFPSTLVTTTTTQTLTNKDLTSGTNSFPSTLATTTTTQTLTNKDLTSVTNSFPSTLATTTTTQTLTNKMIHHQVGTSTDPSISFVGTGFNNTGFYAPSAGVIGITTSGVQRGTISDTLITSLIPVRATIFQATSGTFPTCAFTNSTDNTTGLYFGTTNTCAISCNSATKFTFGSSANTSFQPITIIDGANNNLSINFSSASNLGLYNGGANRLIMVSNGSSAATISNTQFLVNATQLSIQNGSLANAGLNFSGENTGIYKASGVGDMRLIANGIESLGVEQQGIRLYGSTLNGYIATKLSHYEEYTESVTFTCGNQNVASTIRYKRIGNMVQLQFSGDLIIPNPSTAQQYTTSTAIALRFRPAYRVWWYQPTFDNTTAGYTIQFFGSIDTNGVIQYNRVAGNGGATTSGATFYNPCISYSLV